MPEIYTHGIIIYAKMSDLVRIFKLIRNQPCGMLRNNYKANVSKHNNIRYTESDNSFFV